MTLCTADEPENAETNADGSSPAPLRRRRIRAKNACLCRAPWVPTSPFLGQSLFSTPYK